MTAEPPLHIFRGLTHTLLIGPARLLLGIAAVAAAIAVDLRSPVAYALAAFGAIMLALIGIAPGGRRAPWQGPRQTEPEPVPRGATEEPWWRTLMLGALPSTAVVSVLAFGSLGFDARLSAFAGGVLIGMGLLTLVAALEVVALERQAGSVLYFEHGPLKRRFVRDPG